MSPHLFVLLTAILIAAIGKLVFPQWTLRTVVIVALGLPLVILIVLGEAPSLLGLAIVIPLTAVGAVAGVAAAGLVDRSRTRRRPPEPDSASTRAPPSSP